jgi:oligopeptide/dipeptide ABC transporter ATP-binding protein
LPTIPGIVAAPADRKVGCFFAPRCPLVTEKCREDKPMLTADAHAVECWHA